MSAIGTSETIDLTCPMVGFLGQGGRSRRDPRSRRDSNLSGRLLTTVGKRNQTCGGAPAGVGRSEKLKSGSPGRPSIDMKLLSGKP